MFFFLCFLIFFDYFFNFGSIFWLNLYFLKMSDDEYDDENLLKCKITLIGESSVGKTSFIKQYI